MKRLTFKPEHVGPIVSGAKKRTIRYLKRVNSYDLLPGEIVAAVTKTGTRPAFLVPASDRFATLRITNRRLVLWKDLTEEDAALSGVTLDWYRERYPDLHDLVPMVVIEFEVEP